MMGNFYSDVVSSWGEYENISFELLLVMFDIRLSARDWVFTFHAN